MEPWQSWITTFTAKSWQNITPRLITTLFSPVVFHNAQHTLLGWFISYLDGFWTPTSSTVPRKTFRHHTKNTCCHTLQSVTTFEFLCSHCLKKLAKLHMNGFISECSTLYTMKRSLSYFAKKIWFYILYCNGLLVFVRLLCWKKCSCWEKCLIILTMSMLIQNHVRFEKYWENYICIYFFNS